MSALSGSAFSGEELEPFLLNGRWLAVTIILRTKKQTLFPHAGTSPAILPDRELFTRDLYNTYLQVK